MASSDKLLGTLMLLVAAFVFVYYTSWALLTPFLPLDHPLQSFFPAREWAVRLPAFLLTLGITGVGAFIGLVTHKEAKKRRAKEGIKNA